MKEKIKDKLKIIKIEDILILTGLASIITASFFISKIIGLYTLGVILVGLGLLIIRK